MEELNRAKEWHVDTSRIGKMGFSAGAGFTMHSELHSKTMKLAFLAPIYGGPCRPCSLLDCIARNIQGSS